MENLLIYFLKANGLIILFYLMYVAFLRKETFFVSNRWYLISGLVLSLILPLITFTKIIWVEPTPIPESYEEAIPITYSSIEIPAQENPFSFFHYIVINPNRFSEEEFQHILTHESIHVKQKHSIDVLLSKLFCAFFCLNPIILWYRKAILEK